MQQNLTDLKVKKLVIKKTRYEISDVMGLSIRVEPSGSKTWMYRYTFDSHRKRMRLGKYPAMSIAEARVKQRDALNDINNDIDPGLKQRQENEARKKVPTFEGMLEEFWDVELCHKKAGAATKRLIRKDTIHAWGNRKVVDIKRRDIVFILDGVRSRAPVTANRLHGALSRLFNFAAERGVIDDSPCTRIKKEPEKGRSRVLADDEIKAVWLALDWENKKVDMFRATKLAIRMILLTGQRPGEVCGMRWDEISEDDIWDIPADRMKNEEPHQVPLTPLALEVIEKARELSSDKEFVFGSSHKPDAPLMVRTLSRAVNRHWSEMGINEKFVPHDLRRTLRTRLAELGVSDIVAERVLGHKLQGLMAIYNQHQYHDEKRQALLKWENKLRYIVGLDLPDTGKIIQLLR
ncbi:MAG: tyrosine-type recombinase/integrase [Desulfobacteraceae bacterium]|nr:tyrosine-type recombinase/integrase [Desulfobacteraceae bacterium]MBC2754225.1 tyrosine-type recombinase/integrase [Desulfobacteraceae bacterium]